MTQIDANDMLKICDYGLLGLRHPVGLQVSTPQDGEMFVSGFDCHCMEGVMTLKSFKL